MSFTINCNSMNNDSDTSNFITLWRSLYECIDLRLTINSNIKAIQFPTPITQTFLHGAIITAGITNIIHCAVVICNNRKIQAEFNGTKKNFTWNVFLIWIGKTYIVKKLKNVKTTQN